MVSVRVEVLPGLFESVSGKGVDSVFFNAEVAEGSIVGDVIRKIVEDQASGDIIFGPMAVVLNGRLLEALKGLDTKIKDGDIIRLFPLITGG